MRFLSLFLSYKLGNQSRSHQTSSHFLPLTREHLYGFLRLSRQTLSWVSSTQIQAARRARELNTRSNPQPVRGGRRWVNTPAPSLCSSTIQGHVLHSLQEAPTPVGLTHHGFPPFSASLCFLESAPPQTTCTQITCLRICSEGNAKSRWGSES